MSYHDGQLSVWSLGFGLRPLCAKILGGVEVGVLHLQPRGGCCGVAWADEYSYACLLRELSANLSMRAIGHSQIVFSKRYHLVVRQNHPQRLSPGSHREVHYLRGSGQGGSDVKLRGIDRATHQPLCCAQRRTNFAESAH